MQPGVLRRRRHFIDTISLTAKERFVLNEMKRRLGLNSDADVVRVGLFHVAKHTDIEMYKQDKIFQIRYQRKPPDKRYKRKRHHWYGFGKWPEVREYIDDGSGPRLPVYTGGPEVPGSDDPPTERGNQRLETPSGLPPLRQRDKDL